MKMKKCEFDEKWDSLGLDGDLEFGEGLKFRFD